MLAAWIVTEGNPLALGAAIFVLGGFVVWPFHAAWRAWRRHRR